MILLKKIENLGKLSVLRSVPSLFRKRLERPERYFFPYQSKSKLRKCQRGELNTVVYYQCTYGSRLYCPANDTLQKIPVGSSVHAHLHYQLSVDSAHQWAFTEFCIPLRSFPCAVLVPGDTTPSGELTCELHIRPNEKVKQLDRFSEIAPVGFEIWTNTGHAVGQTPVNLSTGLHNRKINCHGLHPTLFTITDHLA